MFRKSEYFHDEFVKSLFPGGVTFALMVSISAIIIIWSIYQRRINFIYLVPTFLFILFFVNITITYNRSGEYIIFSLIYSLLSGILSIMLAIFYRTFLLKSKYKHRSRRLINLSVGLILLVIIVFSIVIQMYDLIELLA